MYWKFRIEHSTKRRDWVIEDSVYNDEEGEDALPHWGWRHYPDGSQRIGFGPLELTFSHRRCDLEVEDRRLKLERAEMEYLLERAENRGEGNLDAVGEVTPG